MLCFHCSETQLCLIKVFCIEKLQTLDLKRQTFAVKPLGSETNNCEMPYDGCYTPIYLVLLKTIMIFISDTISLEDHEVEITAIRAQGAGGQHVNKVSSAIHLRFAIQASSLSDEHKQRLLASRDRRINKDGVLIIKAQQFRTQEHNRQDALTRLQEFIVANTQVRKKRRPTKPSRNARRRRLEQKAQRSQIKALRGKVDY